MGTSILLVIVSVISVLIILNLYSALRAQRASYETAFNQAVHQATQVARLQRHNEDLVKALDVIQEQFKDFMSKEIRAILTHEQAHYIASQVIDALGKPATRVN